MVSPTISEYKMAGVSECCNCSRRVEGHDELEEAVDLKEERP